MSRWHDDGTIYFAAVAPRISIGVPASGGTGRRAVAAVSL
jgi:hypothetical protein